MQWRKVGRSWTSNVFSSFIVCSNRNRSDLVHDLLSYILRAGSSSSYVCLCSECGGLFKTLETD